MDNFVTQENIKRYRGLAGETVDSLKQSENLWNSRPAKLSAGKEAKLKPKPIAETAYQRP